MNRMEYRAVNIMYVEDNDDHALLVISCLRNEQIINSIDRFVTGEDALKHIFGDNHGEENGERQLPDLILCDIKLPGISGLDVLEQLKGNSKTKHIPVIMLTTSGRKEEIARGYELGANSYIVKPMNFEDFRQKMKEIKLYWILTAELPGA